MTRVPQDTSAEEPDGGNLQVRFRRGPGSGDRPGLLNNRKDLIALMAAVAATAALCGCASAPAPQHTAPAPQHTADAPQHTADARREPSSELRLTRSAWSKCVRTAIPKHDDPQSSADVLSSEAVARAAMKDCSDQYTDMMRALARTLAQTCGRDRDCTRRALATAQRKAAQAATEDVVNARVRAAGAAALQCE